MENDVVIPSYARIALDIASRIANGELEPNKKIYGRSILSSEYGVSPETIRKSMSLLADMEIVETKSNSGSIVVSVDNAKKYVESFGAQSNPRVLRKKLSELVKKQAEINQQMMDAVGSMIQMNDKCSPANPFTNYETVIGNNSLMVGKTLAELNFWQSTRATVIAVRRDGQVVLSPGPYFVFQENDILVYIGDVSCISAVDHYIQKP